MKPPLDRIAKMFPQSMIAEFLHVFGPKNTDNLLTVFAGVTLQIPSTKEVAEVIRNLTIHQAISNSKSAIESKRLGEMFCQRYNIKRGQMRLIYNQTARKLREGKKHQEADERVGKHLPNKIKVKRQNKRRL